MSLFVCAKCGCVDNTATSSYWMLTNEYMVDKFDYAKELQPYKGMGLCSECGRLATSPDGRDVVVPGKWHGKFPKEKATEEQMKHVRNLLAVLNSQNISIKQKAGTYFLILTHSLNIEEILSISLKRKDYLL